MSSKEKKHTVFTKMLINEKVALDFKFVNKLLTNNLLEYLKKKFEGKCCDQGYIKPDSIEIVNYSSGIVKNNLVVFDVAFQSFVCYLVEGMEISCIAKNITKAGIRAELDMEKTPAVIFIARDHHYTNKMFNDVQEGSNIIVKIIGQRYELNDTNVSAIAELVKVNKTTKRLSIEQEVIEQSSSNKTTKTSETSEKSIEKEKTPSKKETLVTETTRSKELEKSKEISGDKQLEKSLESLEQGTLEQSVVSPEQPVKDDVIDEEEEALKSLAMLESKEVVENTGDIENTGDKLPQEKEITIVPDVQQPPKRKRGRPPKKKD